MKEIKIGEPFYFAGNNIDIEEGLFRVKYIDKQTGYPFCEKFCKRLNQWRDDGWFWPDLIKRALKVQNKIGAGQ